jgi:hypothetical protein
MSGEDKIKITDQNGNVINPPTEEDLAKLVGFEIPPYDMIELGYTSGNLTSVIYKKGNSTVATLTLNYDVNGNLISITKS